MIEIQNHLIKKGINHEKAYPNFSRSYPALCVVSNRGWWSNGFRQD